MEWFKKISAQVKVVFASIIGILGFVLFFFIREKIRAKQKMEFELSRVQSEIEIAYLEKDAIKKKEKLQELKAEESTIREKIKAIEEVEVKENRIVSIEELDAFFKSRGL